VFYYFKLKRLQPSTLSPFFTPSPFGESWGEVGEGRGRGWIKKNKTKHYHSYCFCFSFYL